MGTLNVSEWTPEQVAEWLSGLGPSVEQYVPMLLAKGLNGRRLLILHCDDLETLGIHIIGHQEIILEALEHLKNFVWDARRECISVVAGRACVVAEVAARSLRALPGPGLDTRALADTARAVSAMKTLAWWSLGAAGGGGGGGGGGGARDGLQVRGAALLALALEAATCAQRDRFLPSAGPALLPRARAAARAATHYLQRCGDPRLLQPADLRCLALRAPAHTGIQLSRSPCGYHHVSHIRFGSPAHASGALHDADEIIQVGSTCVVGWAGGAVLRACAAVRGPELLLRVRRRAAYPRPAPPTHRAMGGRESPTGSAGSPSPSPSPSPPASPPACSPATEAPHTRMYPPKPRGPVPRRHSVCGGEPGDPALVPVHHLWAELQEPKWEQTVTTGTEHEENALYNRDKAVSVCTGLERGAAGRARLDKAHSTPAYDGERPAPATSSAAPDSPSQVAEKSSCENIAPEPVEAINTAMKIINQATNTLQRIKEDRSERERVEITAAARAEPPADLSLGTLSLTNSLSLSPGSGVRGIFPSSKNRSLKKKNTLLAKRRNVCALTILGVATWGGCLWQRLRGRAAPRWAKRILLLHHDLLYAFKSQQSGRASCWVWVRGWTVCRAPEVRSMPHCFKVYHTGAALYFASPDPAQLPAWLAQLAQAAIGPPHTGTHQMEITQQYSETEYSDTESDNESENKEKEKEQHKEKESKISFKRLTGLMSRSGSEESVAAGGSSLDRYYLRFFTRHRHEKRATPLATIAPLATLAPLTSLAPLTPLTSLAPLTPLAPLTSLAPLPPALPLPAPQGLLTLEEFMLQKQHEERAQLSRGRGEQRRVRYDRPVHPETEKKASPVHERWRHSLKRREQRVVPPSPASPPPPSPSPSPSPSQAPPPARRAPPPPPTLSSSNTTSFTSPHSSSHNVYQDKTRTPPQKERNGATSSGHPSNNNSDSNIISIFSSSVSRLPSRAVGPASPAVGPGSPAVGPGSPAVGPASPVGPAGRIHSQYPHLQCPPTFQPETYSLAGLAPRNNYTPQ